MPSAYNEKESAQRAQRDIASVVASLASRQAQASSRKLTGPERFMVRKMHEASG